MRFTIIIYLLIFVCLLKLHQNTWSTFICNIFIIRDDGSKQTGFVQHNGAARSQVLCQFPSIIGRKHDVLYSYYLKPLQYLHCMYPVCWLRSIQSSSAKYVGTVKGGTRSPEGTCFDNKSSFIGKTALPILKHLHNHRREEPYSYAYSARGTFHSPGICGESGSRQMAISHNFSFSNITHPPASLCRWEYFRFSNITRFPLLKYHPPVRVVSLQVGNTSASLISLNFRFSNITHLPASLCREVYFRFSNITQLPLLYYHPPACVSLQGGSSLPPSTTGVTYSSCVSKSVILNLW